MIAERWLLFEPLDTVTVRDGRPFDAGQDSAARTVLPSPTTLGGAVGAAYGAAPGAGLRAAARGVEVPSRLAGPFTVTGDGRVVWPVPRDVVVTEAASAVPPRRLRVETVVPGGVVDDLGACSGRLVGEGDPVEGWWDLRALRGYLSQGAVSPDYRRVPPWEVERRVGLAGEDGGGAAEGMLYSTEHLRLEPGAGFAVRCLDGPDVTPTATVAFGGRGRGAQVRELPAPALPEPVASAPGGRLLLYLATPAVFTGGWRPDLSVWPGCELVAAATGDPQVITTVTTDRSTGGFGGRGRLLWAVPAGSVYYLRFPDETEALAAARALAREPLRQAEEPLATAGFGWTFTGSW